MISAKEAQELAPRGYLTEDELQKRIIAIAQTGENYLWTDLTLEQIDKLEGLGYKVDKSMYARKYKIEWKL